MNERPCVPRRRRRHAGRRGRPHRGARRAMIEARLMSVESTRRRSSSRLLELTDRSGVRPSTAAPVAPTADLGRGVVVAVIAIGLRCSPAGSRSGLVDDAAKPFEQLRTIGSSAHQRTNPLFVYFLNPFKNAINSHRWINSRRSWPGMTWLGLLALVAAGRGLRGGLAHGRPRRRRVRRDGGPGACGSRASRRSP